MAPSPRRRTMKLPPVAGVKRPAPLQLLPPFDPTGLWSSNDPPRPSKRIHSAPTGGVRASSSRQYPTPVPTSSTGILSSSPPKRPPSRPGLERTQSIMSARVPLSNVPTITLPADGKAVSIGRSSSAADYQISPNNPLISRVHVTAVYTAAASTPESRATIEVTCLGWNGVKVHCGGENWDLYKNDTFTSEKMLDILLDIHDSRLLLLWPTLVPEPGSGEEVTTEFDSSPAGLDSSPPRPSGGPLYRGRLPESPVSPTPGAHDLATSSNLVLGFDDDDDDDDDDDAAANLHPIITIYEDDPSPSGHPPGTENDRHPETQSTQAFSSQATGTDNVGGEPEILSDHDEENDPVILSFGPRGDNLLPRMASVSTADSPPGTVRRGRATDRTSGRTSATSVSPSGPSLPGEEPTGSATPSPPAGQMALSEHLINQLAYSRLSSTPISVLMDRLPGQVLPGADASRDRTEPPRPDEVRSVLDTIACVGQIQREGKDAAGKPLETEYYYIPDHDEDETRKEMVVDRLRKPSLRACRKQHKVIRSPSERTGLPMRWLTDLEQRYYWRKPKTP